MNVAPATDVDGAVEVVREEREAHVGHAGREAREAHGGRVRRETAGAGARACAGVGGGAARSARPLRLPLRETDCPVLDVGDPRQDLELLLFYFLIYVLKQYL